MTTDTCPNARYVIDGPRHSLLSREFDWKHAAGVTRYRVSKHHRDVGYYECVAVRGVDGTHHFLGGIQVFSSADIKSALSGVGTA